MGEVYRARDGSLKRDIAVKVLPAPSASDAERLARLQREAELLATLNHPNIAAIYGLEDAGGTSALLLELVEGPTLADRLRRGPLAISEALSIACQIADALDAAHDRDIVHRDLKPANIKVRDDGVVKVLDFGLAKAMEPIRPGAVASEILTTMEPGLTRRGTIVGTAPYMSPEQARGHAVDKRTDIWAFGCVLYEMLTGRAAFARPTVTDTLAAVVEQSPNWAGLPPQTPQVVVRLLRRCLEKDLRRRLRDIADARLDLEDVDGSSVDERSSSRAQTLRLIAAACVLVVGTATAAFFSLARGDDVPTPDPVRFSLDLQPGEELPLDAGLPVPVAMSRDGRSIVYVTRRSSGNRMYLRRSDRADASMIAGTEGGSAPFLSPDGQWLGFVSGRSIRRVRVEGGTPENLGPVDTPMSATWCDDGAILFNEWGSGLFRLAADGGTPEPLTSLDEQAEEQLHQSPFCLPGTPAALFSVTRRGRPPAVELVDVPTGRRKYLLEGSSPQYVSSGHLVFVRNGQLLAVPFDLTRQEASGPAVALADEISVTTVQDRGVFAVSLEGALAYVPAVSNLSRLVLVDATGGSRPVVDGQYRFSHPRYSPDGTRLVVGVFSEAGGTELWVHDLERRTRLRLSASGPVSRPIWSHDGKSITFQQGGSLYSIPADDSAAPEPLLERDASANALFPLAWSRHGPTLVYSRPAPGTNRDVFTLSPGGTPTPFLVTPRDERSAMLSPDGPWMVYAALETGREEEVYVERYPGPGDRVVVSVGGGREPVWSPWDDEIFYRSSDGQRMMMVTVRTEPALTIGRPENLFQGRFRTGLFWADYDVHPKTREFLMLAVDEPQQPRLTVALNWSSVLRRPQTHRGGVSPPNIGLEPSRLQSVQ
jgi:Tol biopolymer transport system component